MLKWLVLASVLGLVVAATAAANEPLQFTGTIEFEAQNDWTYRSDDSAAELNDLSSTIEPTASLFFTPEFYANAQLTLEAVLDPDAGEDRAFGDIGVFAEVVTLNYENNRFLLFGGKFGPNFSLAYDAAPGIYGTDLTEDDIELAERIGLGGAATASAGRYGTHIASASVFFLDTSVLSESVFTDRADVDRSDGGPSNTESLESFVVAIDGAQFPALPGFRYHVGFARQAVDAAFDDAGAPEPDIDDEYRFVVAGEWSIELNDNVTLTPLLEYAHFWNAGGVGSEDRDYLTATASLEYARWNMALAYTGRFIDGTGGADSDDHQVQISAGYAFGIGIAADIGWKFVEESGVQTEVLGALISYSLEF